MPSRGVLLLVLLLATPATCRGHGPFGLFIEVEGGAAIVGSNEVRIPGDSGTRFSLAKDLEPGAEPVFRAKIRAAVSPRGRVELLAAPLSIRSEGRFEEPVLFAGTEFPAGQPVTAVYRFNSYRATYRYEIDDAGALRIGVGATAKIRDAEIRLAGTDRRSSKSDIGLVPLVNFRVAWSLRARLGLLLEGDALAAPQGRAEDLLAAVTVQPADRIRLKGGYRILEGGADNDEVYNFALIHYAIVGVEWDL